MISKILYSKTGRELNKPEWQQISERLFLDEFEDSEDFYKKFNEPTILYMELARRVVKASVEVDITVFHRLSYSATMGEYAQKQIPELLEGVAYRTMYEAHTADVREDNTERLTDLVMTYEELKAPQGDF